MNHTDLIKLATECGATADDNGNLTFNQSGLEKLWLSAFQEGKKNTADYDFGDVINLTRNKTLHIGNQYDYKITGFVLTSKSKHDKCIVDMSAVRWIKSDEFFTMMHPPMF